MPNPYEILDIPKTATEKDIKVAFRKLALIRHPDKGGSDEAFKELLNAYHILIDPITRNDVNNNLHKKPSSPIKQQPEAPKFIFTERDKKIIDYAVDARCNIFLHGPGGTGKTTLINEIVNKLQRNGKRIAITATTGIAALNIGGTTLHRFAGIGLGQDTKEKLLDRVTKNYLARERWTTTEVLVIDEISMLGGELLEKLDFIARGVRRSTKPFGGMQLIISGDFLQLPPIKDKWVFEADCWDDFNLQTFAMKESKRFNNDAFFNMLLRIREGKPSQADLDALEKRHEAYLEYKKSADKANKNVIKPTILYSTRVDVDSYNTKELEKLPGEAYEFEAIDDFISVKPLSDDQRTFYKKLLDENIPNNIILKVGAQVMLRKNLDVGAKLVNGSRGVVKYIDEDEGCVVVKFKNGIETAIYQETWTINIGHHKHETKGENFMVVRQQIPLILAWSMTIHKSQGSTLDYAIIDLGKSIFTNAQAYVALSRVRQLEDVYVSDFSKSCIRADPTALAYTYVMESKKPAQPKIAYEDFMMPGDSDEDKSD